MTATHTHTTHRKNALCVFFNQVTYSTTSFDDKTKCSCLKNHTYAYDSAPGTRYYGYRYYSPTLGRRINRNPIRKNGGVSLHGFTGNNSVGDADYRGLLTMIAGAGIRRKICISKINARNLIVSPPPGRGYILGHLLKTPEVQEAHSCWRGLVFSLCG